MAGFSYIRSLNGTKDVMRRSNSPNDGLIAVVSQAFVKGQALAFTSGKLALAGVSAVVEYICDETKTTVAANEELLAAIKVDQGLFKVAFTPLIAVAAAGSNSTATQAICPASAGSTGDMVGGLVYFPTTGEIRMITANTYGGGNVTLTFAKATARAITTGDTVTACTIGPGIKGVKLNATSDGLDNTLAGASGGKINIYRVDIIKRIAEVWFAAS
jgi:hypothetical protein